MTEYTIFLDDEIYQVLRFKDIAMENAKILSWLRAGARVRVNDDTGKQLFYSRGVRYED